MMRPGRFFATLALLAALPAGAAEISVPLLEMATVGKVDDGNFVLGTHATAEMAVTGGYKYSGTLRFSFSADDIEKALYYSGKSPDYNTSGTVSAGDYNALVDRMRNSASLDFELAKVDIREPFGTKLEFSYYVGKAVVLGSGDEFAVRFGTAPIGSSFRGLAYFPTGIHNDTRFQYEGISAVKGTGVALGYIGSDRIVPTLYAYQDSSFADNQLGRYSFDGRLMGNWEKVKLEAFGGATTPYASMGLYRGGVLAHFYTGANAEFLAQVGVPYWNPEHRLTTDNLYFLFEPRVDFRVVSIIMTLFYRPAYYEQRETFEGGATDVNVKLLFGDLKRSKAEGGLETTVDVRGQEQTDVDAFRLAVGPFFSALTEGVRWDFKLRAYPLKYEKPVEMFETFLGVRMAF